MSDMNILPMLEELEKLRKRKQEQQQQQLPIYIEPYDYPPSEDEAEDSSGSTIIEIQL